VVKAGHLHHFEYNVRPKTVYLHLSLSLYNLCS
jgi:hypothetical protein